ncbi:hypothetical protein SAMN05428970_3842 [Agromyces sp. CF514]|uniref:hypothetical protein n=1 Tax=Agromyces sp. CF514 TaxID=1881031 RepID=UPI0008EF8043|nr:hypothetical protein [Agromyces sp. CF514]SFR91788.1 hypothetical protein SAMN05428970_3842 [Agromyces sp. CF514]
MAHGTSAPARGSIADFDRTTSIWGPITLGLGLIVTIAAALFMAFGTGVGVTAGEFWTAVGSVAVLLGVGAIVEPIMYYPILGKSAMYQAFMIGNIGNKLLPASIVAQNKLGVKAGTKRAEFVSGAAIIGAVIVHIITLVVLVGLLGTWLLNLIPAEVISTVQTFILPAVFGAMVPQLLSFLIKPKSKQATPEEAREEVLEETAAAGITD